MSKKQAKEIRETLHQDMGPLVETSLSHAFWILESAYACHTELNTEAPAQYLDLRPYLKETVPPLERPMVYSVIPEMESMEDILPQEDVERLFQSPLMGLWLMNDEAIEPCVEGNKGVERKAPSSLIFCKRPSG